MNTLKSLVVFAVLGVIGYAVYLGLGGQLNVSVGLPNDPSQAAMDGGLWNSADSPASATAHDHEEDHHGNAQHAHESPRAAASPSPATPSSPYASSTASADYRQEIPPTPYVTKNATESAPGAYSPPGTDTASPPVTSDLATTASPAPSSGASAVASTSAVEVAPPSAYSNPIGVNADASPGTTTSDDHPQGDAGSMLDSATAGSAYVFDSTMKDARQKIDAGHPEDALFLLTMLRDDKQLSDKQRTELLTLMDQIAGTVIYSRDHHLMEPAYVVKAGDSLEAIAKSYDIPAGLLAKINGISETAPLQPESKLKVIRGPFHAVIDTSTKELTLFVKSRYAGRFAIHIGSDFPIADGQGSIVSKTRQHSQYNDHAWIGLTTPGGSAGSAAEFGIVGMQTPSTVDASASRKNIAVSVRDADDLHDILSTKSTITVAR